MPLFSHGAVVYSLFILISTSLLLNPGAFGKFEIHQKRRNLRKCLEWVYNPDFKENAIKWVLDSKKIKNGFIKRNFELPVSDGTKSKTYLKLNSFYGKKVQISLYETGMAFYDRRIKIEKILVLEGVFQLATEITKQHINIKPRVTFYVSEMREGVSTISLYSHWKKRPPPKSTESKQIVSLIFEETGLILSVQPEDLKYASPENNFISQYVFQKPHSKVLVSLKLIP